MTLFSREEVIAQLKQGKSFNKAELSGINLEGVNLDRGNFAEAYLRRANLSKASCQSTDFSGAFLI